MRAAAGLTLLEVLIAALLVGMALVPLMQLYPIVLAADQEAEADMRTGAAAVRKIEEITNRLRADINGVTSGSETCADFAACRLEWTITTEASSATQGVGSLKTISVLACMDKNANSACDTDEVRVQYDAKITSRP